MGQHIFFSCFSFIGVFTVPRPSWSALSSLSKRAFCIPETLRVLLSCDYSLTRHGSIPGSYFCCNIFMVIMSGMSSLPELEGHFFMDIHVPFSVLAAMFMVNQKMSDSLCIEEGELTSQVDVLRVWHESCWFPPWLSSVSSLGLSFWRELSFVSIVSFSSNFNCWMIWYVYITYIQVYVYIP